MQNVRKAVGTVERETPEQLKMNNAARNTSSVFVGKAEMGGGLDPRNSRNVNQDVQLKRIANQCIATGTALIIVRPITDQQKIVSLVQKDNILQKQKASNINCVTGTMPGTARVVRNAAMISEAVCEEECKTGTDRITQAGGTNVQKDGGQSCANEQTGLQQRSVGVKIGVKHSTEMEEEQKSSTFVCKEERKNGTDPNRANCVEAIKVKEEGSEQYDREHCDLQQSRIEVETEEKCSAKIHKQGKLNASENTKTDKNMVPDCLIAVSEESQKSKVVLKKDYVGDQKSSRGNTDEKIGYDVPERKTNKHTHMAPAKNATQEDVGTQSDKNKQQSSTGKMVNISGGASVSPVAKAIDNAINDEQRSGTGDIASLKCQGNNKHTNNVDIKTAPVQSNRKRRR